MNDNRFILLSETDDEREAESDNDLSEMENQSEADKKVKGMRVFNRQQKDMWADRISIC